MKIAIDDVKLSRYQVRQLEEDSELVALAESIEEHGQLQPIKVRPILDGQPCDSHNWEWVWADMDRIDQIADCDGCRAIQEAVELAEESGQPIFECVFGHRRLRAAELAGWTEVEAIVDDVTDEQAQIQALIENTQRKDLEAIELAKALKALKDATGWSIAELARRTGIPEGTVHQTLALLEEPEDIQAVVRLDMAHRGPLGDQGTITREHVAKVRGPIPESEPRADILRKAAKESLTVDQTRKLAERYRDAETPEEKKRVLEVPAKKQEAIEIIHEDLRKAEDRAERLKPPMTPTDYWNRWQGVEDQVKRLALAAKQVEIWESGTWPMIRACIERTDKAITELLEETPDV